MAKRLSVEEKLAALRVLRDQPPSTGLVEELRRKLADRSNLVVAAAATLAGDRRLAELSSAMESAFDRFLDDPVKNDKLCRAKLAIVRALDEMEHDGAGCFLKAVAHVQMEPVWGGQEDSAGPLRAAGILALARLNHHDLLPLLVDLLVDPEKDVRIAAAQALGYHVSEAALLLLRFKTRVGDQDPEVISECLHGLLIASPEPNLEFVSSFLHSEVVSLRGAAILALGKSRLPQALDLLTDCWRNAPPVELRYEILLSIAMLRLPAAIDFLLDLIATEREPSASLALSALIIHRHDPRLFERVAEAISKNGSAVLKGKFEKEFRVQA
jgi:HEAT repeat protein